MSTPTVDTAPTSSAPSSAGGASTGGEGARPVTYATPVPELMARIAERARQETCERVERERWGMAHDPEERWADTDAQRDYIAYLAGAVATVTDHRDGEVLLCNTGPAAARFGYALTDRLDRAAGDIVVGFPCGEIDQPAPGVARYRHRPTTDRVMVDGLRFCPACAVVIAGGDTSGEGGEQAAETIAARWGATGGHLIVGGAPASDGSELDEPAWTAFECDGCAQLHHDRPVPGFLLRA